MKSMQYLLFLLLFPALLSAQDKPKSPVLCGSSLLTSLQMQENRAAFDLSWAKTAPHLPPPPTTQSLYTLPVVVHIVHYAGTPLGTNENISNLTAQNAITWLNEAFANIGYYDPLTGVDTDIQFCLAQRDPNGAATTGIEHLPSPLTNMVMETQDTLLKDVSRWNPNCYINIWVVDEICSNTMGCGVAGYAFFPSEHGTVIDGIVIERDYFGFSQAYNTVLVHEMGHYLGLYHTFEGGCANNNCLTDGDQCCDTPPDQSTTWLACGNTANSCSTDVNSGFATDVNDMIENYMDYNTPACYSIFTANQAARMQWSIANERSSLLGCPSCQTPCATPFLASFSVPSTTISIGTNLTFTNTSTGGTNYTWQINGVNFATTTNAAYTFNTLGTFTITLIASAGTTCTYTQDLQITVNCPVVSTFNTSSFSISPGGSVTFTNTSTGATTYEWFVDFVSVATTTNLTQTFPNAGQYQVYLVANNNGLCGNSSQIITITVGNDCSQVSAGNDQTICAGDTIQLQGNFTTPIPGATIQWTGGGGTFFPNANVLNPKYLPSLSEIAAGQSNLQMQADFIAPGSSITPRLIGYGHNGQDDIFYYNPATGVPTTITANFGDDWLAMGLDMANNILYGISYSNGSDLFSKWDLNTLTHTFISYMTISETMTGGDYDNVHGIFYTIGAQWGTNVPQTLFSINTTTGAATAIGNLGITSTYPGYAPQADGIGGIAYDPLLDVLYGVSCTSDKLYTINVTTGAATFVGNLSQIGLSIRGLAYDFHQNKLWAQGGGSNMYEIDKNTGNIVSSFTNPGTIPLPAAGLTYAPIIVGSTQTITCFDSVKILIRPLPLIDLGNDTSFCGTNGIAISPTISPNTTWQWENSTNISPRTITSSGIYWVEVQDAFGCKNKDSIDIQVITQPVLSLDLGADITTCHSDVIVLDAGAGFASYLWYNLSHLQTNTVYGSGTYFVKCTDICGNIYRDTITININLLPIDTIAVQICAGDSYMLPDGTSATNIGNYTTTIPSVLNCDSTIVVQLSHFPIIPPTDVQASICLGDTYLLPNGISVSQANDYPVLLSSSHGCDSLVTIHLSILPVYSQDIYVSICKGTSYLLPNGTPKSASGVYPTILTAKNGCDSTIITHLTVTPAPISHVYLTLCEQDTVWLPDGTATLAEGVIKTTIKTLQGCDSIIYTHIHRQKINWKNLKTAYELCHEQPTITLSALQSFTADYLWNDGSTKSELFVEKEGTYWVNMTACGKEKTETFTITHCPELFVPNVFTPNGDGDNDEWAVAGLGVVAFELVVFDRWGIEITRLHSLTDAWNGKVKGQDAPEGTYTFLLKATFSDGQRFSQQGTVILMR